MLTKSLLRHVHKGTIWRELSVNFLGNMFEFQNLKGMNWLKTTTSISQVDVVIVNKMNLHIFLTDIEHLFIANSWDNFKRSWLQIPSTPKHVIWALNRAENCDTITIMWVETKTLNNLEDEFWFLNKFQYILTTWLLFVSTKKQWFSTNIQLLVSTN